MLLVGQVEKLQKEKDFIQGRKILKEKMNNKKLHFVYGLILLLIIIGSSMLLTNVYHKNMFLENNYNYVLDKSNKFEKTIKAIVETSPLIVKDIEVKNKNEKWGEKIYSKKATSFYFHVKYFGLKSGLYKLKWKLSDSKGLRRSTTSPVGCTFCDENKLQEGENELFSSGWGYGGSGRWPAGTYRIEIWYNKAILAEKTFQVY